MRIPREQVLEYIEGDTERLTQAEHELPENVDTERDADLLSTLGIDPAVLLFQFNGEETRA